MNDYMYTTSACSGTEPLTSIKELFYQRCYSFVKQPNSRKTWIPTNTPLGGTCLQARPGIRAISHPSQ